MPRFVVLDLTLIHPASKWMHWATLRRHSGLFRAATSDSCQVSPIIDKSLLSMLLQLVRGQLGPGPLLNPREPPNAAPVEVCAVGPCVSHAQASVYSLLPLSISSMQCCPLLAHLFVCYAILEMPKILRCHL